MADKYYVDNECKQVFPEYKRLVWHYNGAHKGMTIPKEEECEIDEIPEEYTLVTPKPVATKKKEENPIKQGNKPTPLGLQAPDSAERLGEILDTYGVEDSIIESVKRIFRFDPTLQNNPQNLETVLKTWIPKNLHGLLPMIISQFLMAPGQPAGAMPYYPYQPPTLAPYNPYPYTTPPYQPPMSWYPQGQPMPGQQPPYTPYQLPPVSKELDDRISSIEKSVQTVLDNITEKEKDKQATAVDERIGKLEGLIADLLGRLTQTEEEKKEQAVLAKIASLEEKIMLLGSQPKSEEGSGKLADAIATIQKEITDMQATANQELIKRLESELNTLRGTVDKVQQERIGHLEAELEDAKKKAGMPAPVGRTEMDAVVTLGEKGIDALKEAGKDARAVFMSPQTRQMFNPRRTTPEQRAQAGEQVAQVVQQEAETTGLEDKLLQSGQ